MMTNLAQAVWFESLKLRRSRVLYLTGAAYFLVPLVGGFFMVVLKDPEMAREMGLISTKAQIVGGSADWSTLLGLYAQATGIGGIILYSFAASWIFGREFSDKTAKDLLALPTPRSSIVFAKFIVLSIWALIVTFAVFMVGLFVGVLVGLPPALPGVIWQGVRMQMIVAGLCILLTPPVAFFASFGRGYLPPMGMVILATVFAQVAAAAGWGAYFPWSIPGLYAGVAGPDASSLGLVSFLIVGFTGVVGMTLCFAWWQNADQM